MSDPLTAKVIFFSLKGQYGTHKGTKEKAGVHLKRIISTAKDRQGRYMRYAVVQYFFKDSPEIPLFLTSHGNSKDDCKMFYPTIKTTLQSLKDLCKEINPSNTDGAVHRGIGNIVSVRSIYEEPRDKKQAYYSRSSVSSTSSFQKDEMFELHNKLRDHQEEMGKVNWITLYASLQALHVFLYRELIKHLTPSRPNECSGHL